MHTTGRWTAGILVLAAAALLAASGAASAGHVAVYGKFTKPAYVAGEQVAFHGEAAGSGVHTTILICTLAEGGCYKPPVWLAPRASKLASNGTFTAKVLVPWNATSGDHVSIRTFARLSEDTFACTEGVLCHGETEFVVPLGDGAKLFGYDVSRDVLKASPFAALALLVALAWGATTAARRAMPAKGKKAGRARRRSR